MSVASPVIDYIDGTNRRIYLRSGIISFHPVDDIYKEIRNLRRLDESLRPFDMFVQAGGNLEKSPGNFTPRFLILRLGTKIVPAGDQQTMQILGEVFTDDPGDTPVFDISTLPGGTNIFFDYTPSNAELINAFFTEELGVLLQSLHTTVYYDSVGGIAGTTTGIGYSNRPVNNLSDALTISQNDRVTRIIARSSLTVDQDFQSFTVTSEGTARMLILTGTDVSTSNFNNFIVTGTQVGFATYNTCTVGNLSGFYGQMRDCGLTQSLVLSADQEARIINGFESDPTTARPTIDMTPGTITKLSIQKYSGNVAITGLNNVNKRAEVNLQGGVLSLDNTCTAGTVYLTGIGGTPQLNGATCTIDETAYIRSEDLSSIARGRATWTKTGVATDYTPEGSMYQSWTLHKPDGTAADPETDPVSDRRPI